ncbi:MAG: hypothetical protein Edafosvirus1_94 [Edafosvirus sp.]|uniref:Uncharacterized protein n=1 Tax=Edafosvirus sp. TaxID=2487765 RepID=A0A3G4ZVW4_9VIRU|nr:MAG: hypothetical protein Edafosvirus1_94 [Edafosvirus sp.]
MSDNKVTCCLNISGDPAKCGVYKPESTECDQVMTEYCHKPDNKGDSYCKCINRYDNPKIKEIEDAMYQKYGIVWPSYCWYTQCGRPGVYQVKADREKKGCPDVVCSISDVVINGDAKAIEIANSCGKSTGCQDDSQCRSTGSTPKCLGGTCVACIGNQDCTGTNAKCIGNKCVSGESSSTDWVNILISVIVFIACLIIIALCAYVILKK